MKKALLLFSALAVVLTFSQCKKKKDDAPATTAKVMFVHGCAAGSTALNLDGRINGVTVPAAGNKTFLQNSGYQDLTSGAVTLSFFVNGLSELVNSSVTLATGAAYTAFAGGSVTTPSFVFATDDLTAPAAGNAKIRFVNLCPEGLNTSCYMGATKIDSNVGYKTCTPFFQVPANAVKLAMIDQAIPTNSAQINSQQLVSGKIYTFMLTGTSSGIGTSQLTLTLINNN